MKSKKLMLKMVNSKSVDLNELDNELKTNGNKIKLNGKRSTTNEHPKCK